MRIETFEDCIAWQKARDLTLYVYDVFRNSKDFSFRDQIQRATLSVMNNIAEGFERGTNKEFVYFLYIAKGSCGEVRSMSYVAEKLRYIDPAKGEKIRKDAQEISKILSGFIRKIK